MAAPVGGLLWALAAFCLRVGSQYLLCRRSGKHFDAFDRPTVVEGEGNSSRLERDESNPKQAKSGKFL